MEVEFLLEQFNEALAFEAELRILLKLGFCMRC